MKLLRTLLAKDLLRIRRKPAGILIQIGMSILIVAMIGMVFGGGDGKKGSGMAPIKMALVDEDESILTKLLEGSASNPETAKHFDVRFLEREEALKLIGDGALSAVLIFPKGMTERYFDGGDEPLEIELIKNPAQSIYPAIVEEGMETVITALNAVSRSFREDLVAWEQSLEEGLKDDEFLSNAIVFAGVWADAIKRLEAVKEYLNPPLVWFGNETRSKDNGKKDGEKKEERKFNLFAYIYVGLGGTFLLMIANSLTSDIYREGRFGTLRRFASIHEGSLIYVIEKSILVVVVTLIAAVVMFVGSASIFRFSWASPLELSIMIVCFAICSAGLTSLIASIAGKEKRADNLGVMIVMGIAMLGGGMVQVDILPEFVRENIAPYLPTAWFIGPARAMQTGAADVAWESAAIKLLLLGTLSVLASSAIFHRRLQRNGGVG